MGRGRGCVGGGEYNTVEPKPWKHGFLFDPLGERAVGAAPRLSIRTKFQSEFSVGYDIPAAHNKKTKTSRQIRQGRAKEYICVLVFFFLRGKLRSRKSAMRKPCAEKLLAHLLKGAKIEHPCQGKCLCA